MKIREKIIIGLLIVAVVGGAIGFLVWDFQRQGSHNISSYSSAEDSTQYAKITSDGVDYTFNTRLDTLLYIGVDASGDLADGAVGQADTIILFVMNKDTKAMTAINFSRDTMTTVQSYSENGNLMGTLTQHLGYAYTFGNGGKNSCENVVWSVSNLMNGIPIEEYCATDVSSIEQINSMVGGVTVTVPNDDLADQFEEMYTGNTVKLTDENVEKFVRYRDISVDFSNNGRRERQKAYLEAYMPMLKSALANDLDGMWNRFTEIEADTITSVSRSEYISMANTFGTMDVSQIEFYTPTGEDQKGENHDEFYMDEDAFFEKILEIFYIKD
jgi:LCP family protein required for cell wall assembly